MKTYVAWPTRQPVILHGKPIAVGGEGTIWPSGGDLAKVYHAAGSTPHKKLAALRQLGMRPRVLKCLALPKALLVEPQSRQVAGYLMQRIEGIPLASVFSPRGRLAVPDWSYGHLVSTARNLSLLFEQVHALGILFGDVSVANFLVRCDTTMVGVDTDSYQLTADGQTYPCPVGTDETTPPELQNTANFSKLLRKPEHDYFGLASLVSRLLMEGIHPFSGVVHNVKLAPPVGTRIEQNLFPFAPGPSLWNRIKREMYSAPTPTASLLFAALSPVLRSLIVQAFYAGHREPSQRPSPAAWRQTLEEFLPALTKCHKNPQHQYFNRLVRCPWCELVRHTGKDHYPANP